MRTRRISEQSVDEVLASAETTWYPAESDPSRKVFHGETDRGRRTKVVVAADDSQRVVTVADDDLED